MVHVYLRSRMHQTIPYSIHGSTFVLSSDRCIFWEEKRTLILSDLHFGKTGHFRKAGIAIPQDVFKEDLQRFVSLLQQFKPATVIVIGDMFHSHDNKEHELFLKWRNDFSYLNLQLVQGNHDILQQEWYTKAGIEIKPGRHSVDNFSFVHDMEDIDDAGESFYFSGHIHPSVSIHGMSKQSLRFPCFYFTKSYAVLPAFGKFTGTYTVRPKKGENVFAVMPADHQRKEYGGLLKIF
ncbi:MAG: ligase-associated DNA damage response endonuclease PdeM [Ferruginibacter sp.]